MNDLSIIEIISIQKHVFIIGYFIADVLDARNLANNTSKNTLKEILVLTFHELHDIANIVAMHVKMKS